MGGEKDKETKKPPPSGQRVFDQQLGAREKVGYLRTGKEDKSLKQHLLVARKAGEKKTKSVKERGLHHS